MKPTFFPSEPPDFLECPQCDEETNSLKEYHVLFMLISYFVYYKWYLEDHKACPSCMRKYLAVRMLVNIVTANILWIPFVFPWHLIQFIATFKMGHSKAINAEFRNAYEAEVRRNDEIQNKMHWEEDDSVE